jgi:hypothetical protein
LNSQYNKGIRKKYFNMDSEPKVIFNRELSSENGNVNKYKIVKEESSREGKRKPDGFFRKAIPIMPKPLAILCCLFNIFIPGFGKFFPLKFFLRILIFHMNTGTLISAFSVFCCAKHGYNSNIKSLLVNLLAFFLQLITAIVIFGWIWSIKYGLLFVNLSSKTNDETLEQDLPIYVRRHSSMEASVLYQQKSRSSGVVLLSKVKEEEV